MQPISKNDVMSRYGQLTAKIQAQAGNNSDIKVENGRYELDADVQVDGVTIRAGSAFDNDAATVDLITLSSQTSEGKRKEESFRSYQEEGGCVFKSMQDMMEYKVSESGLGGFQSQSLSFQV